jgi:hypothetical protein
MRGENHAETETLKCSDYIFYYGCSRDLKVAHGVKDTKDPDQKIFTG